MTEKTTYQPWKNEKPPKRVLFMRLQAMGDVMITLPYIQGFKQLYPEAQVDFLTRDETDSIPKSINLFSQVYTLNGGRSARKQALNAVLISYALRKNKYDVVIDLQNNWISRMIRKLISPSSWSEFDRYSPVPAGLRTENAIQKINGKGIIPDFNLSIIDDIEAINLLRQAGWQEDKKLVVLNPAGFLTSRNWPLEYYVQFSRLWLEQFDNTQFLILGIDRIKEKAEYLRGELGSALIDLVGKTSPASAFAIIQKASLVLSEDSGLMHMAWVSGKATVALFGSSRSDWSRPMGAHSICLNSADLECGECMLAECKFGDVRCLTRFTPHMVVKEAVELIKQTTK